MALSDAFTCTIGWAASREVVNVDFSVRVRRRRCRDGRAAALRPGTSSSIVCSRLHWISLVASNMPRILPALSMTIA